MPRELPNPFKDQYADVVDAAGELLISFGPPFNEMWSVSQVSIEMPDAPVGTTVALRAMGGLVDAPLSARRASAGGDPPVFLYGGETMTVEWENSTPGIFGKVFIIYRKSVY